MEIIKQGDPERIKKTKQFNCTACGCIFLANKDEYTFSGTQYNISYWKCKCPACGTIAYSDECLI